MLVMGITNGVVVDVGASARASVEVCIVVITVRVAPVHIVGREVGTAEMLRGGGVSQEGAVVPAGRPAT